jgi:hypothetical protein
MWIIYFCNSVTESRDRLCDTVFDKTTRYYINLSGGVDIGAVYKESVRVQRRHGIGSFFRGSLSCVKSLLLSGTQGVGEGALKIGSYILTVLLHKQPE